MISALIAAFVIALLIVVVNADMRKRRDHARRGGVGESDVSGAHYSQPGAHHHHHGGHSGFSGGHHGGGDFSGGHGGGHF